MQHRRLGRTGLQVSPIGFGAWGIGKTSWIGADDQASMAALRLARDSGVNFFDTALAYGDGHSERLLAQVFGQDPSVLIASKVPPKNMRWPAAPNTPLQEAFPRKHVLRCLKKTLANLKRDTVDIFQFHVWSDEWANDPEWHATVEEIRRSGQSRFIGLSINDHEPSNAVQALATGLVDVVQVIYNIFDQSPVDFLFPYCQKHDIGVIARVPFDEGGLTGKIQPGVAFPDGDFRNKYFAGDRKNQVWSRVQRLQLETGVDTNQLPELALRFCVSNRAVATVIPGMRNPVHVQSNVAAARQGPLDDRLLRRLQQHRWVRNYYSAGDESAAAELSTSAGTMSPGIS